MKFLIDRCAGSRLATWLSSQGYDTQIAWATGDLDPGDAALLRMAAEDKRILVTIDTDFGTLVYVRGAAHAGIIRLPDVSAAARITLMADLLASYRKDLPGAIVTVRSGRIRILPGKP